MAEPEIAQLYENLSIADEDGEVHDIPAGEIREEEVAVGLCLVGKILSSKKVNREAFIHLIEQLWSQFSRVEIESVGVNVFMFKFNNKEERNRIWQRGPWYFDKSLMVLVRLEGMGNISQLRFNSVEMWIQNYDVPIICMNRRLAKWMAEQIGRVIDIPTESKDCWGKFLKVKVQIDITKPLKQWLWLRMEQSSEIVMVSLKYERLPEFCYVCGRIGHASKECEDKEAKQEALQGVSTKFGSWIRATRLDWQKMSIMKPIDGRSQNQSRLEERSEGKGIDFQIIRAGSKQCEENAGVLQEGRSGSVETVSTKGKQSYKGNGSSSTSKSKFHLAGKRSGLGKYKKSVPMDSKQRGTLSSSLKRWEVQFGKRKLCIGSAMESGSNKKGKVSETKLAGRKAVTVSDTFGNYEAFLVDCRGSSGGLMLLWKNVLQVKVLSFSVGHIDARIILEDKYMWRFSVVYGDPFPSNRVNSWELLGRLRFHSSDHRPILLRFDQNRQLIKSRFSGFHFEPYWLKEVDIGRVIGEAWQGRGPSISSQDFIGKLTYCASRLLEVQQLLADEVFMFVSSFLSDEDLGRDDKGLVVAAWSNQLPGKFTAEMGELITLREGLQLAHFYNMKVDFAEVISPKVVSILNDSIPLVGESKFIMNDIKMLVSVVGITKCLAVSKYGNSLALNLANSAFVSCREWLWLDFWS
ncbi:hypothetical protein EZV62_018469 [Acer yangbiense]|uniref:CCHC-type domain-containing protein n=1 Tax=Acer yangbiense TaxID=1000413 RepID=A0A5C7HLK8_9ROSI|nr:hypothetical protein EZV62_018469 [Acer yangbiense]